MWQLSIPTEEEDGHLGGAEASLAQYYIISCCIVLSYIIVYHIRSHRIASHHIMYYRFYSIKHNILYIMSRNVLSATPRTAAGGSFSQLPFHSAVYCHSRRLCPSSDIMFSHVLPQHIINVIIIISSSSST